ncbi:MAG: bifunctional glutamate N-acetyltransferase/amino-acid acetyltransferase ArgJ [Kiritimatiellae bacterium]|nr:bifunctional glutamate N-acetyltransferase/amino-acid acetyltransferase ArgJ [Kiritimatiellia bacterium]
MKTRFKWIEGGGATSARGWLASGVAAGLKANRTDMAILCSDRPAACAALFTSNNVPAAPVVYDRAVAAKGRARAAVVNVGCANACTGRAGYADTVRTGKAAARALGLPADEIFVCSTGTIGRRLPMDRILPGVALAAKALSPDGGAAAAAAIMTTDTVPKQAAASFPLAGGRVTVGGMCKGSGMICPNLATTLIFLTTDAKVSAANLRRALKASVAHSFNRVTVDGDQSTNDTCALFANGAAGLPALAPGKPGWDAFVETLSAVALSLAKQIVMDGEGATKFVTVAVEKAATPADAYAAARAIANSPLFKAACYGGDPNWGRVIAAVGNSGARCAELKTRISFDGVRVFDRGKIASAEANDRLAAVMKKRAFEVRVSLGVGRFSDAVYTSDLSHGYVDINADYTT